MYRIPRNLLCKRVSSSWKHARTIHTNPPVAGRTPWTLIAAGSLAIGSVVAYSTYSYTRAKTLENLPEDAFPTSSSTPLSKISPPVYATNEELSQAIKEIEKCLPIGSVKSSKVELDAHTDNGFNTHKPLPGQTPLYIVYPNSTEEVSQVMKVVHKYNVPVVPYCGGTSLEGHFFSTRQPCIVLDTSKMNKVLAVHEDDLDCVVQAGVNWVELNDQLQGAGLIMGCDCGPNAKISGMVNTNALGINATMYGAMIHNVISVTAVLADGTIVKTKQRPRKSSAGYNLTHLFIGSEGTLGIITEATVKLHVKPKYERVIVGQFPTILDSTNAVTQLFQQGIQPSAIELLDKHSMHCINYSGYTTKEWLEVPTLFFKLGGINEQVVDEYSKELERISLENNCLALVIAKDKEEGEELFSARKNIFYSLLEYGKNEIHEDVSLWVTDIAVPLSKLSPVLEDVHKLIVNSGLQYIIVGHVGDGNFHADLYYRPDEKEKCERVVNQMMELGLLNEGTSSGEHGIGNGKRHFLEMELGEDTINLMRKLKFAMDPKRLLNPDKIFKIDPEDKSNY